MATYAESQKSQAEKKVVALQKKIAAEAKKLSSTHQKLQSARKSSSRSALSNIAKYQKETGVIEGRKAHLEGQLATAQEKVHTYSAKVTKETQVKMKKETDKANKLMAAERANWQRERDVMDAQLKSLMKSKKVTYSKDDHVDQASHDFFISHASDDKDSFVRGFAAELEKRGAKVWYDEATLKIGDSLRRSIDRGLASSRYGVVVLSESFFKKEWPQRELDGLTALETSDGENRILPIWHKVSKDEVARFSPVLADRLALNTSVKTISEIADELMELLPELG